MVYQLTRQLCKYCNSRVNFTSGITMSNINKLLLFDVDGTLTEPRKDITEEMSTFLTSHVSSNTEIGVVGGSDVSKICGQLGSKEVLNKFKWIFSENGLVVHQQGKEIFRQSIQKHVGEEKLQRFINFALRYMSELTLPVKRGTFIEFRNGLVNVCPVGRSCSQAERDEFDLYDRQHSIRRNFVEALRKEFPDLGLCYVIGGQISIDVFPTGWDKTYCLQHIPEGDFDEIHFFGDKTDPGGNDHEIYSHPRVIGHKVNNPEDTMQQVKQLLRL